jgi:hypothetical protein
MHLAAALVVLTAVSAQEAAPPPPPPAESEATETAPEAEAPPPATEEAPEAEAPQAEAPKTEAPKTDSGSGKVDPNEGLDMMDRWWPLAFDDDLAKPVDDSLLFFFLAGVPCLPFGHIWLPFLIVGENPDGYLLEAILLWVIHAAPHFLIAAITTPVAFVPFIGAPIAGLLGLANCALGIGNCLYFMPVAYANAYSRHIKAAAGSTASARRVPPRGIRVGVRSIAPAPEMAY